MARRVWVGVYEHDCGDPLRWRILTAFCTDPRHAWGQAVSLVRCYARQAYGDKAEIGVDYPVWVNGSSGPVFIAGRFIAEEFQDDET